MTTEPVITWAAIQSAIVTVLNLLVAFKVLDIDDSQMSAINASLAAILPLLFAVVVRRNVTPTNAPQLPEGTTVATTDAKGDVTGSTTV